MKNIKTAVWQISNKKGVGIGLKFNIIDDERSREVESNLSTMEFYLTNRGDLAFYGNRPVHMALMPYSKEIILEEFIPEYLEVCSLDTTCKADIMEMVDALFKGIWKEYPDPWFSILENHDPNTIH